MGRRDKSFDRLFRLRHEKSPEGYAMGRGRKGLP
jgi:hypothetical protein